MKPAVLAVAVVLVLGACKQPKKFPEGAGYHDAAVLTGLPKPLPVAPVTAAELEAGLDACTRYVAAVCACAKDQPGPAHQSACDLASGQPDGIRLAIAAAHRDGGAADEPGLMFQNARKVARACQEDLANFACK